MQKKGNLIKNIDKTQTINFLSFLHFPNVQPPTQSVNSFSAGQLYTVQYLMAFKAS